MHLAGLLFHISYISAIILPTCNNKYSASVHTCIYVMCSVTIFFCFHFEFSSCLDTIQFLVLWGTFKLCLVKPCAHSFISRWTHQEYLWHSNTRDESMDFFPRLLFLGEFSRSDAECMTLYLCAVYKGWFEVVPLYFFIIICPTKFCNFALWGLW